PLAVLVRQVRSCDMSPTRRSFLGAAGATAAVAMAGCSDDGDTASDGESDASTRTTAGLPEPKDAPFDTVVVLMMENRSFDHLLGWMPGVEGQQEGLTY